MLHHAHDTHTGDYIMFKFLFGPRQSTIREGLQRYVDMEFAPSDRAAALERLMQEAMR
jgi:hypothetical protein